uniref:Uncharacterized protein n=1 Tax=viral metagenome TaxID=1070528 RepID=A0A6C0CX75_9ZZZZ
MEFIEKEEILENLPVAEDNNISSYCIILTSTVAINPKKRFIYDTDGNSRLNTYVKSVKQWLDKTSFKIVLVENSGHKLPELEEYFEKYKERFELISFREEDIDNDTFDSVGAQAVRLPDDYLYTSKGTSEMFAIYYAYQQSRLTKTSKFIIKITCRYFVPDFENFLKNINPDDYFALRQNNSDNCEIVGSHVNNISDIFMPGHFRNSDGKWHHHIESVYKDRILTRVPEERVIVCDVFQIEPTQQGGCNVLKTEL